MAGTDESLEEDVARSGEEALSKDARAGAGDSTGARGATGGEDAGAGDAAGDDALYVLTAALLTPAQFPTVLGDDFPEACAALGLEPDALGYGLVLGQDGQGARWTVAVDDVSLVAVAIASWDCGMTYDLSPDEQSVVAVLPGWPLALAVAAPGVPEPHDPEGETALTPPDTSTWGPAQRRLGADEIAQQWHAWRDKAGGGDTTGESAADEAGDTGESRGDNGEDTPAKVSHAGVKRVLSELHRYVDTHTVPPGRVRSSFAPGGARALRADGPGWSFVARTDDMAFVLLDAAPGEVLPVGRGSELPALLDALDEMAVRPT